MKDCIKGLDRLMKLLTESQEMKGEEKIYDRSLGYGRSFKQDTFLAKQCLLKECTIPQRK